MKKSIVLISVIIALCFTTLSCGGGGGGSSSSSSFQDTVNNVLHRTEIEGTWKKNNTYFKFDNHNVKMKDITNDNNYTLLSGTFRLDGGHLKVTFNAATIVSTTGSTSYGSSNMPSQYSTAEQDLGTYSLSDNDRKLTIGGQTYDKYNGIVNW